jgi:hypothetical protein
MARGPQKWSQKVTHWYPRGEKRKRGRPIFRWEDDIKRVAGALWRRVAKNRELWKGLEEAYVKGQTRTV